MHETGFGYVGLASRGTTHRQDIHRVDISNNHGKALHTRGKQQKSTIIRQNRG